MFKNMISQLNDIAQGRTHSDFIKVQRFRVEVINAYNAGTLTRPQYQALYNLAGIVQDEIREELTKQGILHV